MEWEQKLKPLNEKREEMNWNAYDGWNAAQE